MEVCRARRSRFAFFSLWSICCCQYSLESMITPRYLVVREYRTLIPETRSGYGGMSLFWLNEITVILSGLKYRPHLDPHVVSLSITGWSRSRVVRKSDPPHAIAQLSAYATPSVLGVLIICPASSNATAQKRAEHTPLWGNPVLQVWRLGYLGV